MISVCLATFNGERYLATQLASVLSQLEPEDELVIADDGSTDGTLAVIQSFQDERIRLLSGEQRLGVTANFERALRLAKGHIVFLCDQDDVWLPNKRAVFLDALRSADLVVSDCQVTDASLNLRAPSFFAQRGSGPGLLHNLWRNGFLGCCMAFRRELLQQALPFPKAIPMHDSWLGLVAQATASVRFVPEPTLLYRRHGANASPTAERSTYTMVQKIGHRTTLGIALVWRVMAVKLALHRSSRPRVPS